jgi:hypothetical protein
MEEFGSFWSAMGGSGAGVSDIDQSNMAQKKSVCMTMVHGVTLEFAKFTRNFFICQTFFFFYKNGACQGFLNAL